MQLATVHIVILLYIINGFATVHIVIIKYYKWVFSPYLHGSKRDDDWTSIELKVPSAALPYITRPNKFFSTVEFDIHILVEICHIFPPYSLVYNT